MNGGFSFVENVLIIPSQQVLRVACALYAKLDQSEYDTFKPSFRYVSFLFLVATVSITVHPPESNIGYVALVALTGQLIYRWASIYKCSQIFIFVPVLLRTTNKFKCAAISLLLAVTIEDYGYLDHTATILLVFLVACIIFPLLPDSERCSNAMFSVSTVAMFLIPNSYWFFIIPLTVYSVMLTAVDALDLMNCSLSITFVILRVIVMKIGAMGDYNDLYKLKTIVGNDWLHIVALFNTLFRWIFIPLPTKF